MYAANNIIPDALKEWFVDPSTRATAYYRGPSLGMSPNRNRGVVLSERLVVSEVEPSESKDDVVEPRALSVGLHDWRVFIDAHRSANEHMELDEKLSYEARPAVRLFTWNPTGALSLGKRQSLPSWLSESDWRARNLELVERPTGGSIAFHGSDVSIAVVIPRAPHLSLHHLMNAVCQSAVELCRGFGITASSVFDAKTESRPIYCLTQLSPYSLLIKGKKVAGFCARRYPRSYLIHGSLLVRPLPSKLLQAMPQDVRAEFSSKAAPLSEYVIGLATETVAQQWAERWKAISRQPMLSQVEVHA